MQKKRRWITHVDSHSLFLGQSDVVDLGDAAGGLHVSSVTAGSEDDSNLGVGVNVVGGDKSTGSVIDESSEFRGDVL